MARLNRVALDAAIFPSVETIPTRYSDLDQQGHVNNAAVVVLLQEGRSRFNWDNGLGDGIAGLRLLIAGITVEYAGELYHPEPVELNSGIAHLGRTSFIIGQRIRQEGRTAVYAESVMVLANKAGPVAIPDSVREGLERVRLR